MHKPTFSIVHATNRPWGWQAVFAQYKRRFAGSEHDWSQEVEYLLVCDAAQAGQFALHNECGKLSNVLSNPDRPCYIDATNYGVEQSNGRIILLATDDMFPPEEWNIELLANFKGDWRSDISLGEQVLWVNDGVFPHIMTMQIFTRQWWARYGFAFNPAYQSMHGDHDFTLRAQRDGVVVDARTNPRLQWEHCHYRAGTRPKDESDDINAGAARYVEGWRQLDKDWPGYNSKPLIDALYDMAVATETDINEHLPVLRELGRGKNILELGVRTGCSSIAFLAGRPESLTSIDIDWSQLDPQVIAGAELAGVDWTRFEISSIYAHTFLPGPEYRRYDLLFIDTLHTADQIREELRIHAPHADRIVIHDTVANWTKGENGQPGIGGPILDLIEPVDSVWSVEMEYHNNNGLMILRRDGVAPFDYGCVVNIRDLQIPQNPLHLQEVTAPA
jgi:hypothetical protein